ncbi:MAG: NrfA- nitrite reduction protein, partial [Planctomycetaceae bacterium]|nr:NrfA- nitrite reduction protein [Planctomycetaceae bacterium]
HMPRVEGESAGFSNDTVRVVHNQSWNLAPVEKMVRSVCMNCHGLEFSLNALADSSLKGTCYEGVPKRQLKTIDMAESWFQSKQRQKSAAK